LNVGELKFGASSPLAFEIDSVGTITFEMDPNADDLLVSLSWPLEPFNQTLLPKAFEACSLENSPDWPMEAGLFNDKILLMVRLSLSTLNAPTIEALILRLIKVYQNIIKA
jgi:hypothetical protein